MRIPPFPRHRGAALAEPCAERAVSEAAVEDLIAALRAARVGGAFWGARPVLPPDRRLLLVPDSAPQARAMLEAARAEGAGQRVLLVGHWPGINGLPTVAEGCDPWHLADHAVEIRAGAGHELALVGAVLGRPVRLSGTGLYSGLAEPARGLKPTVAHCLLAGAAYRDPFTGAPYDVLEVVQVLAQWRRLIDANRPTVAIFGIARWKRVTLDALLWGGGGDPPYRSARDVLGLAKAGLPVGAAALAWRARVPVRALARMADTGIEPGEIEDGMIRSAGLGANCVPPLSVIVDPQGAHFDPSRPNELENALATADFTPAMLARAAALRARLVAAGISKYGGGHAEPEFRRPARRRVLVIGQVEDDRAVLLGGAGVTNRSLIAAARACEPDAELIYKPHPDVEAGHRQGAIPDAEVLAQADIVERAAPIATLLAQVDAVHVISSLAGFEALLRGVAVTTHGVPFYAGWGLTRDLGPVPPRRGRARSIDELVAAVLIAYPRYLDPVTRLPCPVEVLVERLAAGEARVSSPLVWLRALQGRVRALLRQWSAAR